MSYSKFSDGLTLDHTNDSVRVIYSVFSGYGKEGDYSWMIARKGFLSEKSLLIFNDNEEQFINHSSSAGGGNAVARPLQVRMIPRSAGIPTGSCGKGYKQLTEHVKNIVDKSIAIIYTLLITGNYETVYFPWDDKKYCMGSGIFKIGDDVKKYIVDEFRKCVLKANDFIEKSVAISGISGLKEITAPPHLPVRRNLPVREKSGRSVNEKIEEVVLRPSRFDANDRRNTDFTKMVLESKYERTLFIYFEDITNFLSKKTTGGFNSSAMCKYQLPDFTGKIRSVCIPTGMRDAEICMGFFNLSPKTKVSIDIAMFEIWSLLNIGDYDQLVFPDGPDGIGSSTFTPSVDVKKYIRECLEHVVCNFRDAKAIEDRYGSKIACYSYPSNRKDMYEFCKN